MVKFLFTAVLTVFFSSLSYAEEDTIPATEIVFGACGVPTSSDDVSMSECWDLYETYYSTKIDNFERYRVESYRGSATIYEMFYKTSSDDNGSRSVTLSFTESSSYYECDNPDYPILMSDGVTCTYQFSIDQAVIDAYIATMQEFEGTATVMDAELDSKSEAIEEMQDSFNALLSSSALASSQTTALASMLSSVADAVATYPDSNTISDSYDDLADISFSANSSMSTVQSSMDTLSSLTSEISSNYNSQMDYLNGLQANIGNLDTTTTNMSSCENSSCWDSYVSFSDAEVSEGYDNINNYEVIENIDNSTSETNIDNSTSTVITNVTNIDNSYDAGTTIINNVSNYVDYGETCAGSSCVANPDPDSTDDEEEEEETDEPLSTPGHREVTYETTEEAFEGFYNNIESTDMVNSLDNIQNLVSVPSGSCPEFSINLSDTLIGKTISTDLHCQLADSNFGNITLVMYVVWTFLGYRVVAGA